MVALSLEDVDEGFAARDFLTSDGVGFQMLKIFQDRADAVSVRNDENVLTGSNCRQDILPEERQRATLAIFHAFAVRRSREKTATPQPHLVLAIDLRGLVLVLSLQIAVASLVQG